jgi:hypothetical protein
MENMLEIHYSTWGDNMKMNFKEIVSGDVDLLEYSGVLL